MYHSMTFCKRRYTRNLNLEFTRAAKKRFNPTTKWISKTNYPVYMLPWRYKANVISISKGDIKTNVAQLNQFNHFDNSSINYECIN